MASILVVEDEPDLRVLLRTVIELAGHKVIEADSGEACLAQVGDADLILLDLKLPGMDGWEVLERMPRPLPAKVFVMSASGDREALDRAVEEGCSGFLTKPFRLAELQAILPGAAGDGTK